MAGEGQGLLASALIGTRLAVKQGLEIVPVKWIDKVLAIALERQPVALTEEEVAAQVAAAATRAVPADADAVKH